MNRRTFFGRLAKCVAAAALATHLKFGELAPIPQAALEPVKKTFDYYVIEWPAGCWWQQKTEILRDGGLYATVKDVPPDLWVCHKESDPSENFIIESHGVKLKPGERILSDEPVFSGYETDCTLGFERGPGCSTGRFQERNGHESNA